jgi:hypothetical protein
MKYFRVRTDRSGFALPFALLVIGVLSIGAAALLTRGGTEDRMTMDRDAQVEAFAMAQAGLELFAKDREAYGLTANPPAAAESVRIALPGGYADVISTLIRPKIGPADAIYVIRSRGTRRAGGMAWNADAKHTVAQYSYWRVGTMQIISSWTSLSGLEKDGGAGTISGIDACGMADNVSGTATPDGGYFQDGGTLVPDGQPNDTLYMGTQAEMADAIAIDWNGILNENLIYPDYVVPGDAWPSFADPTFWPVIRVNGDLSLNSVAQSGRGLLIITNNLALGGDVTWDGVVLVGGAVDSNGNNVISGAMVSGLNVQLGIAVDESSIGNGNKTFIYDSCKVAEALSNTSKMLLIPNAWVDNWATW